MTGRIRLLLLGLLVAIVAAGCNVTTTVDIRVDEDGSGGVAVGVGLDDEALAVVPDIGSQLRIDDLTAVGWVVSGPEVESDGLTWIRAAKEFSTPEQLQDVLDEVTGPDGAFRDFVIVREEVFAELRWRVDGVVDLSAGEDLFSDQMLADVLGGSAFGPVGEDLSGDLGPLADAVDLNVSVRLPADTRGVTTYSPSFDDEAPTTISVTSVREDLGPTLWRWVGRAALALFVLAVVLAVGSTLYERRVRARRPAVRTPEPLRAPTPAGVAASAGAARAGGAGAAPHPRTASRGASARGPERRLRLVVVDALTVLHRVGDEPADALVPFAREQGSEVSEVDIAEAHRQATLGRIGTAQLWEACGVAGDPSVLDGQYLSRIPMTPGVRDFLSQLHRMGIPVAAVTNDVADWSRRLRDRSGLSQVHPWIVSAEVGVRKPDPGIYEALRRSTGVPFESCLMIDGRTASLDAAATLGMSTAWFTTDESADDGGGHTPVVGFAGFFKRRR
ncbi:MAG: HAD-IA family hydrolase [Acidimicrobiales bacterium]